MDVSLFDGKGHPTAYIAEDGEHTIYLWKGHAVAYVDHETIFGWNGKHIGWFIAGVVHDLHGRRVGSIASECPYGAHAEPGKYEKRAKYEKHTRFTANARPVLSSAYSAQTLLELLKSGAVGPV